MLRQKEKLDKAEKIVEGVKKKWKEKLEEFEMVEKSIKELKRLWEENEEKAMRIKDSRENFSFFLSLPLPEVPPFLLEKISNQFLKEFNWKKFKERRYIESDLGLFLSAFLNKNIENYILSQKKKGIEEEKIKSIEVHLDVKELPFPLKCLGYRNSKKLHLIIEGNVDNALGIEMEGGEIIVKGNCTSFPGFHMRGGKIVVEGNCRDHVGDSMKEGKIIVKGNCKSSTGYRMQGGEIVVEGNCEEGVGDRMEGGEIIVKGNCERYTGDRMKGGVLILEGEVKSFSKSAFSPENKGTIIWKNTKIWENGNWTKEGKEMKEKGKIPIG